MVAVARPDAHWLLHAGAQALAAVEAAGLRVDVPRLDANIKMVEERIAAMKAELRQDEIYGIWRRRFGERTNFNARDQLATILYEDLKIPCVRFTGGGQQDEEAEALGRPSADEAALEMIDLPFVRTYTRLQKHLKLLNTYLLGIKKHVTPDGYLHPVFNLHTVLTYRSSSSDPNFQNIPIRDPEIGRIIRSCFIARPGHVFMEKDFGAIEVCVSACYHKDPTMLQYIRDGYDMHRDMAGECYMLPAGAVPKACRQQAKALFVFAQFYGDYWKACAKSLWSAISLHKLTTADGVPLYDHLRSKGITQLGDCAEGEGPVPGTFEYHIKKVEDRFWNQRFPIYKRWREDWYRLYKGQGFVETLTGFVVQGIYSRNFIINAPVQGSAFHCLLWSLIQMERKIRKYKMKTLIVGQIHDSEVDDCHESEVEQIAEMSYELMTKELPKAWPWIITPLKIEIEVAPPGGSWFDKKPLVVAA